jgi:ribosome-binding protein aMBF1 (putative translation factor)
MLGSEQACKAVQRRAKLSGMDTAPAPTFGQKIRRARERKCWTQQELADAVQVSRDAVRQWESDQRMPRNRIGALEEVLEIDLTGTAA